MSTLQKLVNILVIWGLLLPARMSSNRQGYEDYSSKPKDQESSLLIYSSDNEVWGLDLETGHKLFLTTWTGLYDYETAFDSLANLYGGKRIPNSEAMISKGNIVISFQNPFTPSTLAFSTYDERSNVSWIVIAEKERKFTTSNEKIGATYMVKPIGWLTENILLIGEQVPWDDQYIAYYTYDYFTGNVENIILDESLPFIRQMIIGLEPDNLIGIDPMGQIIELEFSQNSILLKQKQPILKVNYLWGWLLSSHIQDFISELSNLNTINKSTQVSPFLYWPLPSNHTIACHIGCYPGHHGIDMGVSTSNNTPVYAAADGEVIAIDNNEPIGFNRTTSPANGNYVKIRHDNGYHTAYLHMTQDIRVSLNQRVQAGSLLGYGSNSGLTCGTQTAGSGCPSPISSKGTFYHLHFEVQGSCGGSSCWVSPYADNLWYLDGSGNPMDVPSTGCTDNETPNGWYETPQAGQQFNRSNGAVYLRAKAKDTGSCPTGVDKVAFYSLYAGSWHFLGEDGQDCSPNNECDHFDINWDLNNVPDGSVTLALKVYDVKGNSTGHISLIPINIYTDNPPTISFNSANGVAITTNGQKIYSNNPNWNFSGTANDNNGVTQVKYEAWGNNGNQTAQASGTGSWSYSRNGLSGHNRIQFFAYDTIGQRNRDSDKHYIDLYVDTATPETNAGLSGNLGQNGWYTAAVNVSLQATDRGSGNGGTTQNIPNHYNAGINYVRYQVDGGAWQTYNGTFSVSGDGTHAVNYYAVDNVGNQESQKNIAFKIDATPPTAPSGAVELNGVTSNQWQTVTNDPAFTWNASSDSTSGVARYQLYWGDQINGQGAASVTGTNYDPNAVATGTYYLRGRTQDNAGNWSNWVTLFTFRYDGTPPHNPEVDNQDGLISGLWQNTVRTANFSWAIPFDAGSGVNGYYIYWGPDENGTSTNFTTANQFVSTTPICAVNDACTYYLRLQTRDNVGLKADWVTAFALRYDNTPPVGSLIANHGLETTNQTVIRLDIVASDTGSGVQKMRFSNEGTEWSDWEPFTTPVYWQIPNVGRRDYDILLQLTDAVPNVSEIISDTVFLDINPAQPTSDNYRLWNDSMNSGGEHSNSSSYMLRSSVGQNVDSRTSTSASYQITSGYQAG
ncbi:MAG: M23 family metallopeptidase, partial [Anaerolineales bacterium]|nr:M23 family metallopeptidase [Anaerolineales bacterium]